MPSIPFKIFLASPGDVSELRKATVRVVDDLNRIPLLRKGAVAFHLWSWEMSKEPGYTSDYQADVFKEFGEHCDIFILLLWHRMGSGGTVQEYQAFVDRFKKKNPDIRLLVCNYNKPVPVSAIDPEQLLQLRQFISENQKNWSELGQVRGAIRSASSYTKAIRGELTYFQQVQRQRVGSPAYEFFSKLSGRN